MNASMSEIRARRNRITGHEWLQAIHEEYGFLVEQYGGQVVEEDANFYGCIWIVQVDGARFQFLGDDRSGLSIRVLIGCPDAASPLNEWESPVPILDFIADLQGHPRPATVLESDTPEAIEKIIWFFRHPEYLRWCSEFREWRQRWRRELERKNR